MTIKILITIHNIETGINYITYINDTNIPITKFSISVFYRLLNDIVFHRVPNSNFNFNFKDNKCYCYFELLLKDYLETEYIFTLELLPTEDITDISIIKHQIKILRKENNDLKISLNHFKYNTFKNHNCAMYSLLSTLEKFGLTDNGSNLYHELKDIYSMITIDDTYSIRSYLDIDSDIMRLTIYHKKYSPLSLKRKTYLTNDWRINGYIFFKKNESLKI